MSNYSTHPRILFVTPEVAFVPEGGGSRTNFIRANAGGFGDFPAELISNLFELGADVHVAQPDLIHCFDWMTGLIPAAAMKFEIPSLFTAHKFDTTEFFFPMSKTGALTPPLFGTTCFTSASLLAMRKPGRPTRQTSF